MAVTLTRNLKLRLDSNLTANSKYNLERLDLLGGTFLVDSTDILNIRSRTDILIEPESADLAGSGLGGTVSIGTPSHILDSVSLYTQQFNLSSGVGLLDQATGGNKYLHLQYKSDLDGAVDTVADRSLFIDVNGSDRSMILGGNLSVLGGSLALNLSGATSLSLPSTGTLSTLSGAEVLTNKTLDASLNTITNLTNASISVSAAIAYSKLNLAGSILNADVSPTAAIAYSKLNISNSILNSDVSPSASIARNKLAVGTAGYVLINALDGTVSEEQALATTRGGTGVQSTATYPSSGIVATDTNSLTFSNKSISGASNTLSNINYSSLSLTNSIINSDISPTAAIAYSKLNLASSIVNGDVSPSAALAYSKLNLTGSVVNTDISSTAAIAYSKLNLTSNIVNADVSASAAIAGTKISPDFGNQLIRTLDGLQFEEGGWKTTLRAAQGGQSADIDFDLPNSPGINGQVLITNGSGELSWATVAGSGTVTSVDLAVPTEFTLSGNPITTAGTITISKANQNANLVYAGPASGAAAAPTFRSLVALDLQSIVGYRAMSSSWATASGTSFAVVHNWNTRKIIVEILDDNDNYATIDISAIERIDANTVQLTSNLAPATTWTILLKEIP